MGDSNESSRSDKGKNNNTPNFSSNLNQQKQAIGLAPKNKFWIVVSTIDRMNYTVLTQGMAMASCISNNEEMMWDLCQSCFVVFNHGLGLHFWQNKQTCFYKYRKAKTIQLKLGRNGKTPNAEVCVYRSKIGEVNISPLRLD